MPLSVYRRLWSAAARVDDWFVISEEGNISSLSRCSQLWHEFFSFLSDRFLALWSTADLCLCLKYFTTMGLGHSPIAGFLVLSALSTSMLLCNCSWSVKLFFTFSSASVQVSPGVSTMLSITKLFILDCEWVLEDCCIFSLCPLGGLCCDQFGLYYWF